MEPAHAVQVASAAHDELLPIRTLLRQTLAILVPTDLSSMLWMSSQMVTLYYVSNALGELAVAQYTTGIVIFNMAGFSFIQGFGAAIDTLSSQAYGRDRKSPEVGEVVQFALALDVVLGVCIAVLFYYSEPVMVLLFGREVGPGVTTFLRWSPPYLLVQIISGVLSKTMYAQKQSQLVAIANGAAALTSPVANYFLTHRGVHGAVLALFCSTACCAATHITCVLYHPAVIVRLARWPTPRLRSLLAWRNFFRVGTPALVATCAEWWAFEFQTVLAARISPRAVAINGVAMTLVNVMFSAALGVCVSASVMVGNALGGMRPRGARQYAYFILCCDVVLLLLTAAVVLLLREPIAHLLSSEASLIDGVRGILPWVVLCHMGDSLQFCLQGIFRGAGRQREAGLAVLASLWCVGVPASTLLVLVAHVGVAGCIGGLLVGFVVEIPLLYVWMLRFDWQALARAAHGSAADAEVMVEATDMTATMTPTTTTTTGGEGGATTAGAAAVAVDGHDGDGDKAGALSTMASDMAAAVTTSSMMMRTAAPAPALLRLSFAMSADVTVTTRGDDAYVPLRRLHSQLDDDDDDDDDDNDDSRQGKQPDDSDLLCATGARDVSGKSSSGSGYSDDHHTPAAAAMAVDGHGDERVMATGTRMPRERTESPISPETQSLLPPLLSPTSLLRPHTTFAQHDNNNNNNDSDNNVADARAGGAAAAA